MWKEHFGFILLLGFIFCSIALLAWYENESRKLKNHFVVVNVQYRDMQCTYTQDYEKVIQRIEKGKGK